MADATTEHREFWSKIAHKYDRVVDSQIGPKTRSLVWDRVAQEVPLGNLAEFGCGTGFYTQVLADKAASVVATDLSPGMLALAKERVTAANITFQVEDCQRTSFAEGTFDADFISLVIHFTEPETTVTEMHRILKPGGTLIIANLDPGALNSLDRARCLIRVLYHGLTGYRVKPPKGFGKNMMTEKKLSDLLVRSGFRVVSVETTRDPSRSSNIPVEYVGALRV